MKQDRPLTIQSLGRAILGKFETWRTAIQGQSVSALREQAAARILLKVRGRLHRFEEPVQPIEPLSFSFSGLDEPQWVRHADLTAKEGELLCELGTCVLGVVPAETPVPSMLNAAHVFSEVLDFDREQGVRLNRHFQNLCNPMDVCDSVLKCPGVSLEFTDAWFANDLDLTLRIALSGAEAVVVRAFQYDVYDNRVCLVCERGVQPGSSNLVDLITLNPLLPILIVVSGLAGDIRSTSLLPFPSLCRGGIHHGELLSSADGQNVWVNLQKLSADLVAAWLGCRSEFLLSRIELNVSDAIGAERIFQPQVHDWLAVLGVPLAFVPDSETIEASAQSYLKNNVRVLQHRILRDAGTQKAQRYGKGNVTLRLSANAVPCLGALFAKRDEGDTEAGIVFIVAEDSSGAPRWLVEMPAVTENVQRMQPRHLTNFPNLVASDDSLLGTAFPVGIQFRNFNDQDEARLISPFVQDSPMPLIQPPDDRSAAASDRISVVFPFSGTTQVFAAFLDALSLQIDCENIEIVVGLSATQVGHRANIIGLMEKSFAGSNQIVEYVEGLSDAAHLNELIKVARGEFILVAGEAILFHDQRTLRTLHTIATYPKVGSVGCLLLQPQRKKKADSVAVISGGYWLSGAAAIDPTCSQFTPLRGEAIFPRATYPVIANTGSCFMTRRKLWRRLGAFESTICGLEAASVDYGMRAAAEGFGNYCTTAVSATLPSRACSDDASGADEIIASLWGNKRLATVLKRLMP